METFGNRILKRTALIALVSSIALNMAGCGNRVEETPENTQPVQTAPHIETVVPVTTEATTVATKPPPPVEPDPLEKYAEYYEQNNDFVGWIRIDGITHSNGEPWIDYPVVQTTDNDYYLDKNFEKKKSAKGTIYADYKVPITGLNMADNVTLYGHSNKDGSFFRHILDYQTSDTSKINNAYIINFDTRWEEAQYVIVSCFLVGIYEEQDDIPLFEYFKCRNFDTEEDYNYFYDNIMLRNYYISPVDCQYGDQFLTLSTCAYTISDSRFVVVARKVRDGEDPSVYAGQYERNRDKHMPLRAR